ncbi:unnamed protein product [Chondrus crispus]|uniref:Transcription elongation factor SPT5 n=1 Tax=Chondrus crispus TaxID=2769 RepID=R7Q4H1_CHOCR|nr:unnamed protein product [Chondrus crispus]CDF32768.1 unnamed protein product [Chondrus crispus]|eukprot:XP_005712569.1 unnamed protein product [Chondrus crispus]
MERERALRNEDPGEMERYVRERFGDDNDQYDDEDDTGAPDTSGIDQQSLLPTIKDPRLYIVRCKRPGHERKAILQLLQKSFNLQRKGMALGIFSAVAPEHLKGRIYIEAYSSAQVEYAVSGLDLFSTYEGVKALNLDEMTEVLKAAKRADKQKEGNWVRISRGMYKGDLAQVCGMREGTHEGQLMIRLIPRLDVKGEKDAMEGRDVSEDEEDKEKANGARRKGRPPQHLFDKNELYRLTGSADVFTQRDLETGEVFEVWNEEKYRHGLLYKKVSGKSLITGEQVNPQVEELDQWFAAEAQMRITFKDDPTSMDAEEANRGLGLDINSIAGKNNAKLFKGDSVRVTAGEQRGVSGTIAALNGEVVLIQTTEFPEPLRVSRVDVTKQFKVGDHVKVSSGKKAGYAGAIVRVQGDVLTIFTDSTNEEIRALSTQVADSSDLTTEFGSTRISAQQSRSQYEIFDLVQLLSDAHDKGVVIQVKNEGVQILTTQNQTRVVPVAAIKCKLRDISVRAIDSRGNPIAPNDTIHVVSGSLKDRQGIVKHVAGPAIVFFKARDEVQNCGIMAVPASHCVASTAAARRLTSTLHQRRDDFKMPAPIPRGSLSAGGRGGGGGRSRDPLYRKEVKIKAGPYKGLVGRVMDTAETTVRVMLNAKLKEVSVARTKVRAVNDTTPSRSSFGGLAASGRGLREPNAPSMGSGASLNGRQSYSAQAPANESMYRSRTPRVDRYSAQTPRYGMATPRVGAITPAHNAYGSMTPGRDDFRPGRTPGPDDYLNPYGRPQVPQTPSSDMANPYQQYPSGPRTPSTPAMGVPRTPIGGSFGVMEPRTPANIIEPNTPAYAVLEPRTPAPGMEPATPAPGLEPRTPAPGQEPRTPAPGVEPSTPMVQEPPTPHAPGVVPQTPHVQDEQPAELGYRVLIDAEVLVGSQNGSSGVVIDATFHGELITVRMLNGDATGQTITVPGQEITPVQPRPEMAERKELVKVLDGPSAGRVGRLQNVVQAADDTLEGYIHFNSGETEKLSMSFVAKCHEAT